jgi:hypothetical protein
LICPLFSPTARSAINVSVVSPRRSLTRTAMPCVLARPNV